MLVCCSNPVITNVEDFTNPLAEIGSIHNRAMNSLKQNQISIDDLETYSNDFVEKECCKCFNIPIETSTHLYTSNMMKLAKENGMLRENPITRTSNNIPDSIKNEVPSTHIPFIDKMLVLVNDNLTDSIFIKRKFLEIDMEINQSSLDNEDKNCLWAISAITQSSYIYNLTDIQTRALDAESVILADVEGALAGFISWKFWGKTIGSGLVFGPTGAVVCATKEIVKGAVVGSGVHVALTVWNE